MILSVAAMARSALRVADQVAGRFPDRCVLTGDETAHAVRLTAVEWAGTRWLLGVPGFVKVVSCLPGHAHRSVALPVSVGVWKRWRCRELVSSAVVAAGVTFSVIGLLTDARELVVFGAVVAVAAVAYRTRAHRNFWVSCRLHPADGTIVVEPTHRRFDAAARDLFVRSLR